MKIAAIIITYNRLEFLKEIVDAIRYQTKKPDMIIVVNNASTDGTLDWLNQQHDILAITQDNLGSSGGQWRGLKEAYDRGFDWIWTMDDDVVPDSDCLEKLLDNYDELCIRAPLRYTHDNHPFFNDVKSFNLTNPFKTFWLSVYGEQDLQNEKTEAIGITFEGPLFHRTLIDKIGLPEKNFFIYGDDTEYFIRAWKAGFRIYVYRNAVLRRKLQYYSFPNEFNWKTYYILRNIIIIDRLHSRFPVRLFRPILYFIKWTLKSKSLGDLKILTKAYRDGMKFESNRL